MTQKVEADSIAAPRRSFHIRFLSLAVSGILIIGGTFVMYRWISGPEILNTLQRLDWRWLIAALCAYWLQYPISAVRMHYVMQWLAAPGLRPPPFRLILNLTLSASFIAVTAPVGLVADAAKIGALKYFGEMPLSHAIRCTLFDRVIAAQWMSLWSLATLPWQWMLGVPPSIIYVQLLCSAGFLATIVMLLFLPNALRSFKSRALLKLASVFFGYDGMVLLRRFAVQMAIAALNVVLVFVTLFCLVRASGLAPNLIVIACFVPFLQLVNSLPILYMGWGGREIAMAAIVGSASGLSLNEALVVSATMGVTMVLSGAVNGVFMLDNWQPRRAIETARPPARIPPAV
jgi:uncharacterized membrane protein YbhN (UPF0104 family)